MLRLNVEKLRDQIARFEGFRTVAPVNSAGGVITARVPAVIGEVCQITTRGDQRVLGEVIGIENGVAHILPYSRVDGLGNDTQVTALRRKRYLPEGIGLLGRVVDGLGRPVDNNGRLQGCRVRQIDRFVPLAIERPRIVTPFVTGQRSIDGLLTIGKGQRMGLFAGSGIGKTTLLAEMARGSDADVTVLALIGERSREVIPFLDDCLGPQGLAKSVVVVATSEEEPLMRVQAAETAISIASNWRERGKDVLLLFDSLTRLAMAQREIGLSLGEPPTARGYTPSVFKLLSQLVERLGNSPRGTLTAILTVLVDGDDLDEPISDAVRGLLDGHIILDRNLAEKGHFPPIAVERSISRVFREVTSKSHQESARAVRSLLATYSEFSDLIRIGAYKEGTSPLLDRAIRLMPSINDFLKQDVGAYSEFSRTSDALGVIATAWNA